MFGNLRSDLRGQKTYRIRVQRNLKNQIKADYHELIGLWNKSQNGKRNIENTEQIFERIAWIKASINEFKDINGSDIEGINWGDMKKIDENIKSMKCKIIRIIGLFPSEINSVTFGEGA